MCSCFNEMVTGHGLFCCSSVLTVCQNVLFRSFATAARNDLYHEEKKSEFDEYNCISSHENHSLERNKVRSYAVLDTAFASNPKSFILNSDNNNSMKREYIPERHVNASKWLGEKRRQPIRWMLGHVLRVVVFDLPTFMILFTYASIAWFSHVHDQYLVPQLNVLKFTSERSVPDSTYYSRVCDASDMTTTNGADLFLPIDASPKEAYGHQLKHGFTVFQSILKPETCEQLRNYIVTRNHQITEEESIFVIEGTNRYSFGLGTEEISVRNALMELGNSPRLRPALEEILGPDPALIELTAITATYGAVAQWWHDDVIASGSPVQFGRAFGPSYSVFVQLQNTTKEMGATGSCPGTHFCVEGNMEQFCDENGFQVVGENGYWGQGDALLMNMNSWHRGGAHTDPDGIDRVMLILTFVPKPLARAETRQLSQGITFSLRWDMWGHTLNDIATADTSMTQPWATLRALGLYKSKQASWGIDYITSASIRTANEDNGFRPDDLDEFISRGGFPFLPDWLENFDIDWDDGESWPAYIKGTKELCEHFFEKVSKVALGVYVVSFLLVAILIDRKNCVSRFRGALARLSGIIVVVYLLFLTAKSRVDRSGWASDIRAGRRYTSTVDIDRAFAIDRVGPSTFPTKNDVLIETRYGSDHLAMYNDFVTMGHPGNYFFKQLVEKASPVYNGYIEEFKDATAAYIVDAIESNKGRFLYQGPDGFWMWMDDEYVIDYVRDELYIASRDHVANLLQSTRFVASEHKYGKLRNTALTVSHAVPYIMSLQSQLLNKVVNVPARIDSEPIQIWMINGALTASTHPNNLKSSKRTVQLQSFAEIEPPYLGAWLMEEDEVETFEDNTWYYGVVKFVSGLGSYQVKYSDGSVEVVDKYSIRPFVEYRIGEQLLCFVYDDDDTDWCTIQQKSKDGLRYNVSLDRDGSEVHLKLGELRRAGSRLRTKYRFKGSNYHNA
jgi:ectoine hydroxylase-related dioxygenase (phytanoyl-CoA dioxygenase family)